MKKQFSYGDRVLVHPPGEKPFRGKVYSQYSDGPGLERFICVEKPSGAGVGYRVRYVFKT